MLFPDCTFKVLLPHGAVWAGRRLEASLEIVVPEAIPRAVELDLTYVATAWAGYGSGKNRSVIRRPLFRVPLRVQLPETGMPAGTHHYPFAIDVPPWLPPAYPGNDCGIEHRIETRLDVEWAKDPTANLLPSTVMMPGDAVRAPVSMRTPPGFHESIVLEVTLASGVIAQDEPLLGEIAVRGGHSAKFDAVTLSFVNSATVLMGRGDRRRGRGMVIRVPAAALRMGEAVPFQFPPNSVIPNFRNFLLDNDCALVVSIDIPWARDPEFELSAYVLPVGSVIHGGANLAPVGGARVRMSAAAMARETGLAEGRPPVLIEGDIGPVSLRISDAPREAKIGVDAEFRFPDVELGTSFRPPGFWDRDSNGPLLPPELRAKYVLSCKPEAHTPEVDVATLAAFFGSLMADLGGASELRLSDNHLAAHFDLADDDGSRMIPIARFLHARAKTIADAIRMLPFPPAHASSRAAWDAVANEQNAFLVPTGPALYGLRFGAQLFDGSERVLYVTIRTTWDESGPGTRVDLNLELAPVPEKAWPEGESDGANELVRAVRNVFPVTEVNARSATLERPGFTPDPRALFDGVEAFLSWVLEARGERRAAAPYR